jgi:hypothetical protein
LGHQQKFTTIKMNEINKNIVSIFDLVQKEMIKPAPIEL